MSSTSKMLKLEEITAELGQVAIREKQLQDREALLVVLQEFRNSSQQTTGKKRKKAAEAAALQAELDSIRDELEELEEKKEVLQQQSDEIMYPKSKERQRDMTSIISKGGVFVLPRQEVLNVAPPPSFSAPQVILNTEELYREPVRTLCPSCHQYITTETVTRVGSVAWLVCTMMCIVGCAAGCCLLPFCLDTFKDVDHKCPKCSTRIHTSSKL